MRGYIPEGVIIIRLRDTAALIAYLRYIIQHYVVIIMRGCAVPPAHQAADAAGNIRYARIRRQGITRGVTLDYWQHPVIDISYHISVIGQRCPLPGAVVVIGIVVFIGYFYQLIEGVVFIRALGKNFNAFISIPLLPCQLLSHFRGLTPLLLVTAILGE